VTGRGGETLRFGPFTVEPILGRHGVPPAAIVGPIDGALRQVSKPLTPEESAEQSAIRQRGTSDRRVIGEGTIAYLITLDDGFRIMYRDSGGDITEYEKAVMQRIGRVDLGLMAVGASYLNTLTAELALEQMHAYRPDVFMPAHHDAPNSGLWRAIEPISEALRDDNPDIVTVSKSYREPVCFNTEFNIQRGH
jgi:L-ascorbate metabolism protein UlaG (beta-lactamase superfamily)